MLATSIINQDNKICYSTCLVAALQSRPHHIDIPYALETIVNPTICEINDDLLNRFVMFLWVHKFIGSKFLSCKVEVNDVIKTSLPPQESLETEKILSYTVSFFIHKDEYILFDWICISQIADLGVKKARESYHLNEIKIKKIWIIL